MKIILSLLASVLAVTMTSAAIDLVARSSMENGNPVSNFDESAAEIVSYDPVTKRLFVVNANIDAIDIFDISNVDLPVLYKSVDVSAIGGPNSVDVNPNPIRNEVAVAVATESPSGKPTNGYVVFLNTDGDMIGKAKAGYLPDMLTYDATGNMVVVANEGEPTDDYKFDPKGSVTIVDVTAGPALAESYKVSFDHLKKMADGVRITGPKTTTFGQDLEPEFVAISPDNSTAYVVCQENNCVIIVDLASKKAVGIAGLGYKDHSLLGNGLDASNRDDAINITTWPVRGLYMPDSIAAYEANGMTYIVSANEGDSREYEFENKDGDDEISYIDEDRIKDAVLDPTTFPDAAALQEDEALGRLKFITTEGDTDGDGDYDELYTFGARSFSIWAADGSLVWDSGDEFEQRTAQLIPDDFNSTNDENGSFDNRSDDKGPEPEGLALGAIGGSTYAFIGLERVGGIIVYDITNPAAPVYQTYVNNRDFTGDAEIGTAGDLGPEGLEFIPASVSPTGTDLLVVGNEVSGTTTIYDVVSN